LYVRVCVCVCVCACACARVVGRVWIPTKIDNASGKEIFQCFDDKWESLRFHAMCICMLHTSKTEHPWGTSQREREREILFLGAYQDEYLRLFSQCHYSRFHNEKNSIPDANMTLKANEKWGQRLRYPRFRNPRDHIPIYGMPA
jgi:hypothetical protein